MLADSLGDTEVPLNHAAVAYPRNLTLIRQFAGSIIVGWEPLLVQAVWIPNIVYTGRTRDSAQRLRQ